MPLAAPFDFARSMEQRSLSARSEKRIKGSLGYLSPIEYRESLGLAT
ncbi:integrase catalytic region [Burkholderia contaminans]|uniref:Integrase catalytic region n=1 Tax=Burkholderia contaminans TaxID=488447 RepID=A0A6P3BUZ7_9BURK|nr:integrase catalytic region [Burkholderia contaminans]